MKKYLAVFLMIFLLASPVCRAAAETDAADGGLDAVFYLKGDFFISSEEFSVSLVIEASSLRGGTAKLLYDDGKMTASSVTFTEEAGIKADYSVSGGVMTVVFYNGAPYTGTFELAKIDFIILDGEENDVLTVTLDTPTVSDGANEITAKQLDYTAVLTSLVHTELTETDTETDFVTEPDTETGTATETDTGTDGMTEPVLPGTETDKQPEVTDKTPPTEDTAEQTKDTAEGTTVTEEITRTTETETETDTETDAESGTETETGTETDAETEELTTGTEPEQTGETDTVTDEQTSGQDGDGKSDFTALIIVSATVAAAGAAVGSVFLIKRFKKPKSEEITEEKTEQQEEEKEENKEAEETAEDKKEE